MFSFLKKKQKPKLSGAKKQLVRHVHRHRCQCYYYVALVHMCVSQKYACGENSLLWLSGAYSQVDRLLSNGMYKHAKDRDVKLSVKPSGCDHVHFCGVSWLRFWVTDSPCLESGDKPPVGFPSWLRRAMNILAKETVLTMNFRNPSWHHQSFYEKVYSSQWLPVHVDVEVIRVNEWILTVTYLETPIFNPEKKPSLGKSETDHLELASWCNGFGGFFDK